MHVGVPVAPVSPAYSLMSKDFGKLKYIFELVKPGLVFAADPQKFAPALAAVGASSAPVAEMLETNPGSTQEREFAKVKPETVAKILFTSGSTGIPKGVINTHRMLCANQQMLAQAWPFVEERAPVVVDWLPWNHTFGGNHNFNLVLRNGGTMYVDGGKPVPGLVETTVRNLKEVAPTMYFNVPRGYDLLLPFLEKDAELRAQLLPRPRRAVLRRRGLAAEPLGTPQETCPAGRKYEARDAFGLGLDRDRAARDLGALPAWSAPA